REEGPLVLEALASGALDYVQKPSMGDLDSQGQKIIEKARLAARSRAVARGVAGSKVVLDSGSTLHSETIIGIGSSTGGTEALREILTQLPAVIPPILVVQHIPPIFSAALAQRLDGLCAFAVKEAENGDQVL